MRRPFGGCSGLLVGVLVVGLAVLALLVGAAAAQERTATTNATTTPSLAEDDYVIRDVDEAVSIVGHRYDKGSETFYVKLKNRGESSTTVTITEAISPDTAGGGTFGIVTQRVRPASTSTVAVSVSREKPVAVMITTQESVSNGEGVYLAAEAGGGLFEGAATWGDVQIGALVALAVAGFAMVVAAWHYVSQRHADVEQVEVIES